MLKDEIIFPVVIIVVIVVTLLLIMYRYCQEKIDVYHRFELRKCIHKYAALKVFLIKKGFFVYRLNTGHAGRRSEESTSGKLGYPLS